MAARPVKPLCNPDPPYCPAQLLGVIRQCCGWARRRTRLPARPRSMPRRLLSPIARSAASLAERAAPGPSQPGPPGRRCSQSSGNPPRHDVRGMPIFVFRSEKDRRQLAFASDKAGSAAVPQDERLPGLARTSHTVAGAGSVIAAPRDFRALPIRPVLAAARKPLVATMTFAIIPRQCEKSGLADTEATRAAPVIHRRDPRSHRPGPQGSAIRTALRAERQSSRLRGRCRGSTAPSSARRDNMRSCAMIRHGVRWTVRSSATQF